VAVGRRSQVRKQLIGEIRPVADEDHVATGRQRGRRSRRDIAHHAGSLHRQVVGKYQAVELEPPAQDRLQPLARKACRVRIHPGIDHVGRHDAAE
jgi:hypothetical protein